MTSSHQLILAGSKQTEIASRRMQETLESLQSIYSSESAEGSFDIEQAQNKLIEPILAILSDRDGFDVLDVLRQYEIPITPAGFQESISQQLPATVDILGLILADKGRFTRTSIYKSGQRPPISDELPRLHELIYRVIAFAVFESHREAVARDAPLGQLAAQARNAELIIRGKTYTQISSQINDALFESMADSIRASVGHNLGDVRRVAAAAAKLYSDKKFVRINELAEIRARQSTGAASPSDNKRRQRLIKELFITPGTTMSFRVTDLVEGAGLTADVIKSALVPYTLQIVESGAEGYLSSLLRDALPIRGKGLVIDQDGSYCTLAEAVPHDYIRENLEQQIQQHERLWQRYQRHRASTVEKLAFTTLAVLLGNVKPLLANFQYFSAPPGNDISTIRSDRPTDEPLPAAWLVENDALFVVEDVAFCVEVKAGRISERARSGHTLKMAKDLKSLITVAQNQAFRLRNLISANQGVYLRSGKWVDLRAIREIHSIVVCLDDLGPLGIAADILLRSNVISRDRLPWVVSLHDLMVLSELFESPADFLLYVRRRTEPTSVVLFQAMDELDLAMLHLSREFYFHPDPDELHLRFPRSSAPTKNDRRRFRNQPSTHVGTHTDPLDAWMYWRAGESHLEAPKPRSSVAKNIREMVAFLEEDHKPGWFSAGADLLGLSGESARELGKLTSRLNRQAKTDHGYHTILFTFAGLWGFCGIFLAIAGSKCDLQLSIDKLTAYVTLKKHQLELTRALAVMFDEDGKIVFVYHDNSVNLADPVIDAIVREAGLSGKKARKRSKTGPSRKKKRKHRR